MGEIVENPCLDCTEKCCQEFKITTELVNPSQLTKDLEKFSYIKRVGSDVVLWQGHEKMVGKYSCERFDKDTGLCRDYDFLERPEFCYNTGEKFIPSLRCNYLLKNIVNEN